MKASRCRCTSCEEWFIETSRISVSPMLTFKAPTLYLNARVPSAWKHDARARTHIHTHTHTHGPYILFKNNYISFTGVSGGSTARKGDKKQLGVRASPRRKRRHRAPNKIGNATVSPLLLFLSFFLFFFLLGQEGARSANVINQLKRKCPVCPATHKWFSGEGGLI